MKNTLTYQGYFGSVEFSAEDDSLCGKAIGIKRLICKNDKLKAFYILY